VVIYYYAVYCITVNKNIHPISAAGKPPLILVLASKVNLVDGVRYSSTVKGVLLFCSDDCCKNYLNVNKAAK
jgi:hypothetical protein